MNNFSKKSGVCYIVGAASFKSLDIRLKEGDYLIAADGGYDKLIESGYSPNLIIGDFDSSNKIDGSHLSDKIIALNPIKDDTDMLSAVKKGLELGYIRFKIFGGVGGRLDHTFANIQTLKYLARNKCEAELVGENQIIKVLKNGSLSIPPRSGYLSVFSLTEKSCVTLQNLKYPLDKYEMSNEFPIGISNEFIGKTAVITVDDGVIIVIYDILKE